MTVSPVRRRIGKRQPERRINRQELKQELLWDDRIRQARIDRFYPLDAPGMPPPGPNFIRHALALGDERTEAYKAKVASATNKTGFRQETRYHIGPVLEDLYRRALCEAGFQMPIHLKNVGNRAVTFVPGHIWGQAFAAHVDFDSTAKVDGPHAADVMVIGKIPGREEEEQLRNLVGPSGEILVEMIQSLRIFGSPKWYITNLLKFRPPDGSNNIRADWRDDCLPLLHQELRLVRPKYILCLGADASKLLLGPKFNVSYMEGRVAEYSFPIGVAAEDHRRHTAEVMTVLHPVMVAREEPLRRTLERGMARFNLLQKGVRFDKAEEGVHHLVVDTLEELKGILWQIEKDALKRDSVIAVDAEWHGEHPVNAGSYLRTIQLAWRPKHAVAIKLHKPGGAVAMVDADGNPAIDQAVALLRDFLKGKKGLWRKKRVVGHFLVADLEWLVDIGLDIRAEYAVPLYDLDLRKLRKQARRQGAQSPAAKLYAFYRKKGYKRTVPAYQRTRYEGGADTGMMAHAIEETASYRLESLLMRYTTCPRYDVWLHDWRESYCKEQGIAAIQLEGYGDCPDYILVPTPAECAEYGTLNYGCYDADGTLRLYYQFQQMLDCDYEGNCCREAFWEDMIVCPAILEMHRNGILVNRDRVDYLTERFLAARGKLEARIKRWARWPEFNIRSVQHVKEFLFGEERNGKKTDDGQVVTIRPQEGEECGFCGGKGYTVYRHKQTRERVKRTCQICDEGVSLGAKSLYLDPLLDTSKPPKLWAEIVEQGREREFSPSTNKMVLSVLAQENAASSDQVNWIRDYRFLDQVLRTILRPPRTDDDGEWVREETDHGGMGNLVYDAGLASVLCDDGRVRTHLYQTKETGRWSSARPNLHNISKQRDDDYKRLLGAVRNEKGKWTGGDYKFPLRSLLHASPGHVLVEADYVGAELYCMAIMSGDPRMIDHATRNQLPEDDPNYYDIHSNVAVMAFGLPCKPTKKGLDGIGKAYLRIIAKSVIFGIAYGRGAKAIALAAKEQGVKISVDEAQQVIDTIFAMYPGLVPFFTECRERSKNQRWLCHSFGRFRRFPFTSDFKLEGDFERQAMNFPIQGMVASIVNRAIAYLRDGRERLGDPSLFRMLLQIHDALLLEVPYRHVEYVTQKLMPWAMRDMVPIWPTRLNGRPTGKGPYRLGVEIECCEHWGEKLTAADAPRIGLSQPVWAGDGVVVKYYQAS